MKEKRLALLSEACPPQGDYSAFGHGNIAGGSLAYKRQIPLREQTGLQCQKASEAKRALCSKDMCILIPPRASKKTNVLLHLVAAKRQTVFVRKSSIKHKTHYQ